MRIPIQVLVYPVRQNPKWEYLLLKRIPRREGFWQGVTGALKEGETVDEAARRELFEETRLVPLKLEKIDFIYSFPVADTWRHLYTAGVKEITEYVYVALIDAEKEPVLDPGEHDQYTWCTFCKALHLLSWPNNKKALHHVAAFLQRPNQWQL